MPIVNLRKYDYYTLKKDIFVDVSDEVAAGLLELRRAEDRVRSRIKYHKAYYSLDFHGDVEKEALDDLQPSPEEIWLEKEQEAYGELMAERLAEAMAKALTPIQAKRIHAVYMDKRKIIQIAADEGVGRATVYASTRAGLKRLKAYFVKRKWTLWDGETT